MTAAPLRIAVTGSAGTGKTTLARALAERLGLPVLREEMRDHLVASGRPLAGEPPEEVARVVGELWRTRLSEERRLGSFVADNCALDFAAYALHHGALEAPEASGAPALVAGPVDAVAAYDALLVLPWGTIPYERDGVRPANPHVELRYQAILEGLLHRHADPARVHFLPQGCTAADDRLEWALGRVEGVGRQRGPARRGTVYLVGAGPGDPGLVTLRAVELLRSADVVAHDELVPPAVLELAGSGAERVAVGRRHHGSSRHPLKLHPEVLARARAGRSVVRLKAGDPFVFGRGGEEAEELTEAGIPFEVVPGVSAALGAAASAVIPLTHRDHASDVTFATGHDLLGCKGTRSDWAKLAGSGTLVLYMASRALAANLARLVELGRSPATPAAWVASATRPDERIVVGTLADLATRVGAQEGDAPALVIVGEVVALRERLAPRGVGGGEP